MLQIGDVPIFKALGVTGIGEGWSQSGWRSASATGEDPWATLNTINTAAGGTGSTLPGGVSVDPTGGLSIGGLEWLGARAYDPASRGFLSVDPLEAPVGAGWGSNPYSYAGNDPLHMVDPLGLAPVSDAELSAYADSLQSPLQHAMSSAGDWLKNNWEYVAVGAMVVGGALLMATPLGPTVGKGLIMGGVDAAIQKATTGEVNWKQVAVGTVMGMIPGMPPGASALKRFGMDAAMGAIENSASYLLSGEPITLQGLATSATVGVAGALVPVAGEKLKSLKSVPEPDGVVYLREDLTPGGMKPYVGQAKSEARFEARQAEHAADHPSASFRFEVLARAEPGGQLDRYEQAWIDKLGGPTNKSHPDGGLSNRRNQMNPTRYAAGGDPYA